MKKFTILHTIETGGPGGAETIVLNLASRLDRNRFRSIALLPSRGWLSEQIERAGVPLTIARSKAWHDLHLPKEMARLVRAEQVDLIHSHLADQNFYACLVGRYTRRKTVVTYHGLPGLDRDKIRGSIKSWAVRKWADGIVVVSDHLKKSLIDLKFPAERITRIHNGVDFSRFETAPQGRFRAELGYQNGTKLVGMVANLRESKGYEYFVQAAKRVVDANPETRFVAVGEMDKTISEKMRRMIQEMALGDRFLFAGFRRDVPAILADLDVFVLSSTSEGFSLATVEAMAASRPVIVTRSGGPQEIVDEGQNGILVPPADADALAREISSLLERPDRARELGAAGHKKAVATFGLDKMVSDYEQLYERLLSAE